MDDQASSVTKENSISKEKPRITNFNQVDYYFDSYNRTEIHRKMLKDTVRTLTYRNVIYHNKHLFKGKVVLDIGCGTGILSLFAAKAGAAKVYAVDCSEIVKLAKEVVKDNNYSEIITVVEGKMDDVDLPGCDKVDIIISEWMGYCLFYENMLETVIVARDKWLRSDGLIFPDKCNLFISAIDDEFNRQQRFDWLLFPYNFNMSDIRDVAITEPFISYVHPSQVMSTDFKVKEVDLFKIKKDDLFVKIPFRLVMEHSGTVHALMTYFTVHFNMCHKPLQFSTAPHAPKTHWGQTVFHLNDTINVKEKEVMYGTIRMKHNVRNHRDLDFNIDVLFNGERGDLRERNKYKMR